jgi:hypothetical protein
MLKTAYTITLTTELAELFAALAEGMGMTPEEAMKHAVFDNLHAMGDHVKDTSPEQYPESDILSGWNKDKITATLAGIEVAATEAEAVTA